MSYWRLSGRYRGISISRRYGDSGYKGGWELSNGCNYKVSIWTEPVGALSIDIVPPRDLFKSSGWRLMQDGWLPNNCLFTCYMATERVIQRLTGIEYCFGWVKCDETV